MPAINIVRNRGATTIVEAHGEILFMPSGMMHRWTNSLSNRISRAARNAAPTNKRPRWGHYGAPLKSTITTSTSAHPEQMRVFSNIGSSAPYAAYVEQGTGVFAGGAPYEAKVLPPYAWGEASLYERTWRPGGPGQRRVAPVMIKGQRGQFFLDEGLRAGFSSMRLASVQTPGTFPRLTAAMDASLVDKPWSGATPSNGAFRASLAEWRVWRDAAWKRGEGMGKGGSEGDAARKYRDKVEASKKPKAPKAPKAPAPTRQDRAQQKAARATDRANFLKAMVKKYGKVDTSSLEYVNGYWEILVWGKDAQGRATWLLRRGKAKT